MLNRASLVVVDGNLSAEALSFLGRNVTVPLFADPVSVKKAGHLSGVLRAANGIKPNRPEAALLSGVDIRSNDDLPAAAAALHQKGVENVFISLGGEGVYYDNGEERGILPILTGDIRNTNGCGDAFLAAAADGYLSGLNIREVAMRGLAASALCARSESAVSPYMCQENLISILDS